MSFGSAIPGAVVFSLSRVCAVCCLCIVPTVFDIVTPFVLEFCKFLRITWSRWFLFCLSGSRLCAARLFRLLQGFTRLGVPFRFEAAGPFMSAKVCFLSVNVSLWRSSSSWDIFFEFTSRSQSSDSWFQAIGFHHPFFTLWARAIFSVQLIRHYIQSCSNCFAVLVGALFPRAVSDCFTSL